MFNAKKMLTKVGEMLNKSLVGTISNVYWWNNSWTAPSDGMMVIRVTPKNASWYFYVKDSSIQSFTGGWSHQFRGTNNAQLTATIPVKKGAVFSTASISNVDSIQCIFFPMKVGGVLLKWLKGSIFNVLSHRRKAVAGC